MSATETTDRASGAETGQQTPPPVLRVVSGNPTAEEIAVITAVVAAASAGTDGDQAPPAPTSWWSRASRVPGQRVSPGPGAWRASAFPR